MRTVLRILFIYINYRFVFSTTISVPRKCTKIYLYTMLENHKILVLATTFISYLPAGGRLYY